MLKQVHFKIGILNEKQKGELVSMFFVELARVKQGSEFPSKQELLEQNDLERELKKKEEEIKQKFHTQDDYIYDLGGYQGHLVEELHAAQIYVFLRSVLPLTSSPAYFFLLLGSELW